MSYRLCPRASDMWALLCEALLMGSCLENIAGYQVDPRDHGPLLTESLIANLSEHTATCCVYSYTNHVLSVAWFSIKIFTLSAHSRGNRSSDDEAVSYCAARHDHRPFTHSLLRPKPTTIRTESYELIPHLQHSTFPDHVTRHLHHAQNAEASPISGQPPIPCLRNCPDHQS